MGSGFKRSAIKRSLEDATFKEQLKTVTKTARPKN